MDDNKNIDKLLGLLNNPAISGSTPLTAIVHVVGRSMPIDTKFKILGSNYNTVQLIDDSVAKHFKSKCANT